MKKEDIYLDLSKLTTEQQNYIIKLLPKEDHKEQYSIFNRYCYLIFQGLTARWWVVCNNTGKTEVSYEQFLHIFRKREITNRYVFGKGMVSAGSGTTNGIPAITVSKLKEHTKVGTDLLNTNTEETETIVLEFNNMKGFKVFEKMVKNTKKLLKAQKK